MIKSIIKTIATKYDRDFLETEADFHALGKSFDKLIFECEKKKARQTPSVRASLAIARGENVIITGPQSNKVAEEMSLILNDPIVYGHELLSVKRKSQGINKAVLCILSADLKCLQHYHSTSRTIFCSAEKPNEILKEYFTIIEI